MVRSSQSSFIELSRLNCLLFLSIVCFGNAFFPSSYPDYCTKNISSRNIPSLSAHEEAQVDSLIQVQVVVRHGARTPYGLFSCWQNYSIEWNNCNVTEIMMASPSYKTPDLPSRFFYRKIYDGFTDELGGNCLTGQLLYEGYQQETELGNILANAYLTGDKKLFPTDVWEDIDTNSLVYLRSDDMQRVLMSGQLAIHNMFNVSNRDTIVPWHTGDYSLDQIYPNSNVCPRLNVASSAAFSSAQWTAWNNSDTVVGLTNDLNSVLGAGHWTWNNLYDCFMTAVCTENEVPNGSADGVTMTNELFQAALNQSSQTFTFSLQYNNSLYSKLALGNIAWHISTKLQQSINGESTQKLVFYAAHDTSLLALLAAMGIWDGQWVGYASLLTIEVYNSSVPNANALFRVVYNGLPVVLPGCASALCDIDSIIQVLAFGQETMPCSISSSVSSTPSSPSTAPSQPTLSSISTASSDASTISVDAWIGLCLMSGFLGTLIGSAAIIFSYKNTFSRAKMQSSVGSTNPIIEIVQQNSRHGLVKGDSLLVN